MGLAIPQSPQGAVNPRAQQFMPTVELVRSGPQPNYRGLGGGLSGSCAALSGSVSTHLVVRVNV